MSRGRKPLGSDGYSVEELFTSLSKAVKSRRGVRLPRYSRKAHRYTGISTAGQIPKWEHEAGMASLGRRSTLSTMDYKAANLVYFQLL